MLTELRLALPVELMGYYPPLMPSFGDRSHRFESLNCRMNDAHDRMEWPLSSPALTSRMFDMISSSTSGSSGVFPKKKQMIGLILRLRQTVS